MSSLIEAVGEINEFLSEQGWQYCLVGGMALSRWGEVRATVDVDLCLLTGIGDDRRYIDALLRQFAGRVKQPAEFAELNRVLLIRSSQQVGIDVALAWTPFEQRMIERAVATDFGPNLAIPTANADDMIVTKAFASRPQDWIDVEGIIVRQGKRLNWEQIVDELTPLCELKEAPEIVDQLLALRTKIDAE